MDTELFEGVMLTRPGLVGLLAEDGATLTVLSEEDPDPTEVAALLEEARHCGLPEGVQVVDEWPSESEYGRGHWVTVWA